MSGGELLAMLSPHGPSADGGGRGGHARLTPQDVAAALAWGRLHPRAELAARAAILSDRRALVDLVAEAEILTRRIAAHEGWGGQDEDPVDGDPPQRLAVVALRACLEVCLDTSCRRCAGTGWRSATLACGGCSGTGRGLPLVACSVCQGARMVTVETDQCRTCNGRGRNRWGGRWHRCRPCRGSGRVEEHTTKRTCANCTGTGTQPLRDRQLARLCQVSPSSWSRRWAPRVRVIAAALQQDLEAAEAHCRRFVQEGHILCES